MKKPRKGSMRDAVERIAHVVDPIVRLAHAAVEADLSYADVAKLLEAAMDRVVREKGARP